MEQFKDEMSKRAIIKDGIPKGTHKWYELQQLNKYFDYASPSIIYPDISLENRFIFSKGSIVPDMTCFFFPAGNNHLLPLLNSTMFKFLAAKYCPILGNSQHGGRIRYKSSYLSRIPFPALNDSQKNELLTIAESITAMREERVELSRHFAKLARSHVEFADNLSIAANWWKLDFNAFLKTLKVNLSLSQKDELLQLFDKYRSRLLSLDNDIQKTDYVIDQLAYRLYDLTPEEIALVEGAN